MITSTRIVTAEYIRRQIKMSEMSEMARSLYPIPGGEGRAIGNWAHDDLASIWDDLTIDDNRAREGLGLDTEPCFITSEAYRLLTEYMSTH